MTYRWNAISLLFISKPVLHDLFIRYYTEDRAECSVVDAGYCLDAPNFMPAGGCQAFATFSRKGANFSEQIEVQRP